MAQAIEKPCMLLVEGKDEVNFFDEFLKHIGINTIQLREVGKYSFRQKIKDLMSQSGFSEIKSIGIIRDADESAESAFTSICDSLQEFDWPVPQKILEPTPKTNEKPKILIMIMPPDNEGTGRMLEDLCLASVEKNVAECINQYFECLKNVGIEHREVVLPKAKIHAFLASRPEPDKPSVGVASQAGYWNFDSPVFDKVKNFLKQVAEID